jgi:flagellar basal body-associated protein FliL
MSWLRRHYEDPDTRIPVETGEHRSRLIWIVLGILAGLAAGAAVIWLVFRPKPQPDVEPEAEAAAEESY